MGFPQRRTEQHVAAASVSVTTVLVSALRSTFQMVYARIFGRVN